MKFRHGTARPRHSDTQRSNDRRDSTSGRRLPSPGQSRVPYRPDGKTPTGRTDGRASRALPSQAERSRGRRRRAQSCVSVTVTVEAGRGLPVLVRDAAGPVQPACSGPRAPMQSPYLASAMDLTPYSYNRTMAEYFHSCKSESRTHARERTCLAQLCNIEAPENLLCLSHRYSSY